jgi:hypothetical protein
MSGLPSLCRLYLFLVPSTEKCLSGNGMEPAAASSFLPPISFQGERRRGDHKNIFPATCFSLLFVFAQEAHKTTTKESGNGFPLSFNTPLYSLSAWCPSCLLCALK